MGSGILEEEYVQALRPLQDGIPPRSFDTIKDIIERSTGQQFTDMFETFEEHPVGAATIAQAHRATLRVKNNNSNDNNNINNNKSNNNNNNNINQKVIVKVQYPEVAELFDADLNNLEMLIKLVTSLRPGRDILDHFRKTHERELDFRWEAAHLQECATNMQNHGLEPNLVRIPQVRNETGICTKDVLVMEYLEGISLRQVMEEEQDRIARALGMENGDELRFVIGKQMKEHFEQGGGEMGKDGERGLSLFMTGGGAKVLQKLGPLAIRGLRSYAHLRDRIHQVGSTLRRRLQIGRRYSSKKDGETEHQEGHRIPPTKHKRVNLGRALKTLIHVHGLQVMLDGKNMSSVTESFSYLPFCALTNLTI